MSSIVNTEFRSWLALDAIYICWQFSISARSYMLLPVEAAIRCIASLPYLAFASLTALRTRSELLRLVSVDDLLPGTLTRMLGACSKEQLANMHNMKAGSSACGPSCLPCNT